MQKVKKSKKEEEIFDLLLKYHLSTNVDKKGHLLKTSFFTLVGLSVILTKFSIKNTLYGQSKSGTLFWLLLL